ncbi:SDR family NAD(P)-dependent oxidoreductase [Alteromonas oceanisediminis]|uniref:SDR family NAD(P)-dependent oxidoreductase n=1 Tax=Alteromonas oceanisediminis TaxID=2836180 RepID=UPI001BDA3652|nr:SDR family oxidoreductase [Alteromonas oceanisediminis]MBT0586310.1 SDR family oxidoreductase [Alteromonas oceanisediminis]
MANPKEFFAHKTVVISGAGSGIGAALAFEFAAHSAQLALCDINQTALQETVSAVKSRYPHTRIYAQPMDVSHEQQWCTFLAASEAALQNIDIVINNAGIEGASAPVWATSQETLERVMNVNFYGMVHGSKASLPFLAQRPWAAIVNVSSVFGLIAPPNTADYCASKFAIRGYTEAMRAELSEIFPHIQVHLVHPGGINTQIARLQESQQFKQRFLTTPPSCLAKRIANAVMRNQARLVYGNQASMVNLASRLLPLSWLNKILAKQMLDLQMTSEYYQDHSGLTRAHKKSNVQEDN